MKKVSVVIPARNEIYLNKTLKDIFEKAEGEIEVIVTLDGYWIDKIIENVIYIHNGISKGMRSAINEAVAISSGDYVLKCDAHVMFDKGFDKVLQADCDDDWVVVPKRRRLDPEAWDIKDPHRADATYMFLTYPDSPTNMGRTSLHGKIWEEKNKNPEYDKIKIDDLMSAQGSCWFMKRSYFDWLELMDVEHYGEFANEFQEIGLKCWLSGGRVIVNKKTYYAHWFKKNRGYHILNSEFQKGYEYTKKWMTEDKLWHKQKYPLSWLIKKFYPVPGWPEEYIK